jgi:Na+-transporting methylmalonyl-CoA/oxaloacetate decarboxylase beta subunit
MNQKELSNLSFEELKQKKTSIKTVTWMLTIVLIASLCFFIFISIKEGFTPLLAVPFALSAILPVNFKNIKILTKEIESRKSKI